MWLELSAWVNVMETLTDTHAHTIKHTFSTKQVPLTYCVSQNCALIFVFVYRI